MKGLLEICCGSFEDVKTAWQNGADRVELNSALYLGGLTPSTANLICAKEQCSIPIVTMVRPRGGGFCYSQDEYETMLLDARILLEHGADGIAFGFLTEDHAIHRNRTQEMIDLIHSVGKEAVFHRAFDCVATGTCGGSIDLTWCGPDPHQWWCTRCMVGQNAIAKATKPVW